MLALAAFLTLFWRFFTAHSILTTVVLGTFTVVEREKSDEEIEMEREKECPGHTVVKTLVFVPVPACHVASWSQEF